MRYKAVLVLFMFLVSLSLVQALKIDTLLSQDPDPVEPGQIVKVKFKIANEGESTTKDVIVRISPKFPFTIYNDVTEKNIGKLRAGQTGTDAAIVEFRLKVDEDAVEGDNEIELFLQVQEGISVAYTDDEFLIDIQTHDAVLEIVKITSEPEQIPPGETGVVNFLVKNLADSMLKDIKFRLGLDSSTIPLAPYQSSSERRISHLESDYQKTLSFVLIADPDAEGGLHKVPLNITYNDEKGNAYHVEDVLAVLVGEKPNLKAYLKRSTSLQSNQPTTLTLELANPGATDIKFLEIELLPSEDYELISTTDYFYIGDLDSDDTESEEIDIFVNRGVKELSFPIKLKYTDSNNQQYQQQFNPLLKLYSSYKLKKFGLIIPSKAGIVLGILLIAGGLFYFYRKRKKK